MMSRRKRIAMDAAKKVVYRMEQGIKEDEDVRKTAKKTMILMTSRDP